MYPIVISEPIFIVGIYTVLPFLSVFVYKYTVVLLVLAFFYVNAITVKVREPQFFSKYSEVLTDVSRLKFWKSILCVLPFLYGKVVESQGNKTKKFLES